MSAEQHELACPELVEAAPYSLGALEESESERYRDHLRDCAVCRQQLAALAPVVAALPEAVGQVAAPALIRERLMAVVRSEAELLKAAGHEADRAPSRRRRWRLRPVSALAGAAALAAGVAIGAVAINTGSGSRPAVHVTRATVAAAVSSASPRASAVLRQAGGRTELVVNGLPAPPRGRIYQVWIKRGNTLPAPTNALFGVTNSGSGSVDVPGSMHGVTTVMVTAEPLGGSLAPTSEPVLAVTPAST